MRGKRNSKKNKNFSNKFILFGCILLVILFILFFIIIFSKKPNQEISSIETSDMNFNNINNSDDITNNIINDSTNLSNVSDSVKIKEDISFSMAVTGDIMCHNTMYKDAYDSSTGEYNFSYMFDEIKYYLQTSDITVGNLETTFAGSRIGYSSYPTFNTPESLAYTLKKIGFDVLSTANNHCLDKGYSGLESTINYLNDADISHTGTFTSKEEQNSILIKNVKNVSIAFLSFTYGTNGITIPKGKEYCVNLIDEDLIIEQLNLAKEKNPDLICVCMHWGNEYQTKPNSKQQELADFLFKNGADIILGNHPHVLQSMEKRIVNLDNGESKECFVVYSLGNFMADQKKTYTRDSAILKLNITKNGESGKISINSATYTPTYIYKNPSVSTNKFKILDIEKNIAAFEEGYNTSINHSTYKTLASELDNINKIVGGEIN